MDYKEKLEEAKRIYETANADQKYVLESLFPELIESEDERIKKEIIDIVKSQKEQQCHIDGSVYDKMIAWLEKQGQVKESPISQHENKTCKENDDSLTSEDDSKFKVGDWIVNHNIVYHIDKISGVYLTLSTLDGTALVYHISVLDSEYTHLWNIEDAKDGDVLVDKWGDIGIYQTHNNEYEWCSYCSCTANGKFVSFYVTHYIQGAYLATKEQRDTLKKAMADVGWEFDFEKKEFKWILSNKENT